jgi:hypothetical protein
MKRAFTIGILALLLAVAALRPAAAGKLIGSVRSFGRQFQSLKSAQSMSPIERFVLSLVLTS